MMDVSVTVPKKLLGLAVASLFLGLITPASAQEGKSNSDLKISGFLSIVGGKILNGNTSANYLGPAQINENNCPCYTADWSNAGVYTDSASLTPESRVGIQVTYKMNANTTFVGQLASRGTDGTPNVQWAYGGYKLNPNWEIQVGRKRIPLYYYSDFQDISVSYPWISPPPELYGWEATNYNGASLRYNGNVGDTNVSSSIFMGSEKVKDSLYQKLYFPGKTEVSWKNLTGVDFEASNGPLTSRLIYMQADVRNQNTEIGLDSSAALNAVGIAINLDFENWFVLSEVTQLKREFKASQYTVTAPAFTIGAGWRIGQWTPFINYAEYTEKSSDLGQYSPQSFKRSSLTLRYDLGSSSAIKAQIDRNTDVTNNFGGNSTLFRISYDRVF
jgi:hypothetical protein